MIYKDWDWTMPSAFHEEVVELVKLEEEKVCHVIDLIVCRVQYCLINQRTRAVYFFDHFDELNYN